MCRLGTPIVSGYVGEVTVLGKDERKILRIVTIGSRHGRNGARGNNHCLRRNYRRGNNHCRQRNGFLPPMTPYCSPEVPKTGGLVQISKKGRRAEPGALGERESLACQIGPKFKLCTRISYLLIHTFGYTLSVQISHPSGPSRAQSNASMVSVIGS